MPAMTTWQAIEALACVGQLALALLAAVRSARSPLGIPLALLCLDLFAWNGAELAAEVTHHAAWSWLDFSASPLTTPLVLDFVLAFTGKRRELRGLRITCWLAFGAVSAASALAFVWPPARAFAGSDLWATLHLGGAIPVLIFAVSQLVLHLRGTHDPDERARAGLLLAAAAAGALLGTTEMWGHFLPQVPSLGAVGLLVSSTLMTLAAVRLRLLDSAPGAGSLSAALGLAAAGMAAYFALFKLVAGNAPLLVFGSATVSLALVIATRQLVQGSARRRARLTQLATLGRFSAQMAHDLKNPLAALKGAAQFLEEQLARESAPPERRAFVQLILDQVERVRRTLDHYQRLSQVQPALQPLEVNQVVREVLALQPFAAPGAVQVRAELAEELPRCAADKDLLSAALENLVQNAFEAMQGGGAVTVRTARDGGSLVLSVEDTGAGMDARTREQAFDEFFTTKARGSGLGLPFVRRVAEAHGGTVSLSAAAPRGTVVRLRLPLQ